MTSDTVGDVCAVEANTGAAPDAEIDLAQVAVMLGFAKAIIHYKSAGYAYPGAVLVDGGCSTLMKSLQALAGLVVLILRAMLASFAGALRTQGSGCDKRLADWVSTQAQAISEAGWVAPEEQCRQSAVNKVGSNARERIRTATAHAAGVRLDVSADKLAASACSHRLTKERESLQWLIAEQE